MYVNPIYIVYKTVTDKWNFLPLYFLTVYFQTNPDLMNGRKDIYRKI